MGTIIYIYPFSLLGKVFKSKNFSGLYAEEFVKMRRCRANIDI